MSISFFIKIIEKGKIVFTDSETDKCLYAFEEVKMEKKRMARIHHSSPEGDFEILAELQYKTSTHPTRLVYKGKMTPLDEFCKKIDGTRAFVASDGKQYGWDPEESGKGKFELRTYDVASTSDDPVLVAKIHKRHYGIFHKARKLSLEILPPGRPIQDDILIALCVAAYLKMKKNTDEDADARAEIRSDAIGDIISSTIGILFTVFGD